MLKIIKEKLLLQELHLSNKRILYLAFFLFIIPNILHKPYLFFSTLTSMGFIIYASIAKKFNIESKMFKPSVVTIIFLLISILTISQFQMEAEAGIGEAIVFILIFAILFGLFFSFLIKLKYLIKIFNIIFPIVLLFSPFWYHNEIQSFIELKSLSLNRPELCNIIVTRHIKDDCFNLHRQCDKIQSRYTKNDCYLSTSKCDLVQGDSSFGKANLDYLILEKNECYYKLAIERKNENYCNYIQGTTKYWSITKNKCFNEITNP